MAKNLPLLWLPTFQPGEPWLVWNRVSGRARAKVADPAGDPVEIARAAEILAANARIKLVLGDQHPLGERSGGVVGKYRDLDLAEDVAAIELRGDQVDGRAADLVAGGEASLVGLEPLLFGQQRRVDIDHPAFPFGDELVRDDPHESGQRDQVDVAVFQRLRAACPSSTAQGLGVERFEPMPSARAIPAPGASGLSPVTSATS